jgi:hypothetical protein
VVFPDLFKEEESCTFSIDGGMHRDEVHTLGYTVDDVYNCMIAMGFRQFNYKVDADHVPWCLQCLRRVELTDRSLLLHFHPVAQITGLDIDADVMGHLGPPVITGYELEGLEAACMSSDACIMGLFDDTTPQVFVFWDIDLTMEHE